MIICLKNSIFSSKCLSSSCVIVASSKSLLCESLTPFKCEECEWLKTRIISIVWKHITFIFWLKSFGWWKLVLFWGEIWLIKVFYKCFTSVLQVFNKCFTSVLQVFHQCFISISPVFYQCFTSLSPLSHQCFTSVSPVSQKCVKSVSKVFQSCSFVIAASRA